MKSLHNWKLPNLYIPGAGKSGTSTLHELLNAHPDICMSKVKEPHFWTWPDFKDNSDKKFNDYTQLFENQTSIYQGESSTGYLCFPYFKERILQHYTNLPKFIIILRNPIDRAYSHYWWLKGIGSEDLSFKKALLKDFDIEPSEAHRLPEANFKHYYQFGLYGKWIQQFYEVFGKENIHILTTESLKDNRLLTLNSCFEFLGLKKMDKLPKTYNNKTTILRFPKLYKYSKKIAWGDYKVKKILKIFFPIAVRNKLKGGLYKIVYNITSTSKAYPKITDEQRKWTKNLYEKDVQLLKKITEKDFIEWTDF